MGAGRDRAAKLFEAEELAGAEETERLMDHDWQQKRDEWVAKKARDAASKETKEAN